MDGVEVVARFGAVKSKGAGRIGEGEEVADLTVTLMPINPCLEGA